MRRPTTSSAPAPLVVALTQQHAAAAVAGLTVYDMVKAVARGARLTDVQLEHKAGGKSGSWTRGSWPAGSLRAGLPQGGR